MKNVASNVILGFCLGLTIYNSVMIDKLEKMTLLSAQHTLVVSEAVIQVMEQQQREKLEAEVETLIENLNEAEKLQLEKLLNEELAKDTYI